MVYLRISDPAELETLSAAETVRRLRPLLNAGGLCREPEQWKRIEPNIVSVCAELAASWKASPKLSNGKTVSFADYLAACVCTTLRHLDRRQHPDLYDAHGKYQPENRPLPLADDAEDETSDEQVPRPPTRLPVPIEPATQPVSSSTKKSSTSKRHSNILRSPSHPRRRCSDTSTPCTAGNPRPTCGASATE